MYRIKRTAAELRHDLLMIRQACESLEGCEQRPSDALSLDDIVQHLTVSINAGAIRQTGALFVEFNKLYSARPDQGVDGPVVKSDLSTYVAKLLRGEVSVADSLDVVRDLERTSLMLEAVEEDWSELYRAVSELCRELGESWEPVPSHGYALADELKRRVRRRLSRSSIQAIGD